MTGLSGTTATRASTEWWRSGVVYQVYPRSFADSDGDGVGDLPGVTARLDHVQRLGADAVWLTPFFRSPQADHGYDVSEYCDVDPLFGTLADADALVAAAHERGLRVIVDLVPNHCSDQHPLFQAALRPGAPERALFHVATSADGPPNDWPSVFGGPAWTRLPGSDDWYLHLYAPEQHDWNWREPRVHEMFRGVLRFWLDRGVDGIRIDVAHGLYKAEGLPDLPEGYAPEPMRLRGNPHACDQEEVHDVYREWRRIADSYDPPRVLVGEVNLSPERAARFTRPDELHQAFAFALVSAPWDAASWAETGAELLRTARPVTWVVENHDVARVPTRYGGGEHGLRRARAALLAVLGLPGAAYVYQGQELGLPEVDVPEEARQDPAWFRSGVTRDGCRVPLPWRQDPSTANGFSVAGESWLPQPEGWGELSVALQEADPASTLHLTRAALRLRRTLHEEGLLSVDDEVEWDARDGVLTARRGDFALVVAMGDGPVALQGDLLLSSEPLDAAGRLPADAAAWVRA
ncbi:alpha-amylase family glycosyl hydrolase [Motilibacter rhizosphaerae]|nr:alpha-amylase family glycosyl hydrolase [Motilibacter rhizosphaerae]